MLLFDILTLLALLLVLAAYCLPIKKRPRWLRHLPLFALVLALIHLVAEGFRWQMVPAYAVLVLILLWSGWRSWKSETPAKTGRWVTVRRFAGVSIGIILLLCSGIFAYLFPMFDLPQPSGSHAVGTSEFHMIDHSRPETYTPDTSDVRELMVRVWYPAASVENSEPAYYWREAALRSSELAKGFGMPSFLFSHAGLIPTHSFWDAPLSVAQSAYPVLIFSHGFFQGSATQNTSLVESLASHGYVVFSIDHAYIGTISIYPDGRLAVFDRETFSAMFEPPGPETSALYEEMTATADWREQVALLEKAMASIPEQANTVMVDALAIQQADQLFVLEEITKLQSGIGRENQPDLFKGRLDLLRLGIFGMSFGGSTALGTCVFDPRCKAGINLDGFQGSQIDLPPLERPFMFMNNDSFLLYNAMFEKAAGPAYAVSIGGSTHMNFLDTSIMSPLFQITGALGPIDGYRMLEITEAYVLAFFDKYLKGQNVPLIDSPDNDYSEVEFRKRNAS